MTRLSSNDSPLVIQVLSKVNFHKEKGPSFGRTMSCNEKQLLKSIMTDAIVALISLQEAPKESH